MNNDVPLSYQSFRTLWSVLHIVVLVAATILLGLWWVTDGNGTRLVGGWWAWASGVQRTLFEAVPFPWD